MCTLVNKNHQNKLKGYISDYVVLYNEIRQKYLTLLSASFPFGVLSEIVYNVIDSSFFYRNNFPKFEIFSTTP